jgi:hypothetical protein
MSEKLKEIEKPKTIQQVLSEMQKTLKAPKNQYNSFGKYKYRSCEDILEGIKSILPEGYSITISDEIVNIGTRYYVKATASLTSDTEIILNHAYAREEESKKGMDGSQVTGAASSYARKYALNGLFAIDDTKDADSDEHAKQADKKAETPKPKADVKPLTGEEFLMIQNGLKNAKDFDELKEEWTKAYKAKARMTSEQYKTLTKCKDINKHDIYIGLIKEAINSESLNSLFDSVQKEKENIPVGLYENIVFEKEAKKTELENREMDGSYE